MAAVASRCGNAWERTSICTPLVRRHFLSGGQDYQGFVATPSGSLRLSVKRRDGGHGSFTVAQSVAGSEGREGEREQSSGKSETAPEGPERKKVHLGNSFVPFTGLLRETRRHAEKRTMRWKALRALPSGRELLPPPGHDSFILAVIVYLAVNLQPGFLLTR
jgi:hypothetical protein